jgi:hypothetical protein
MADLPNAPAPEDPRILQWRAERERLSRLAAAPLRDRYGSDSPRFWWLALPAAAAGTLLLYLLYLPAFVLNWFATTLHEFGHAVPHWLSGRAATPIALGPGMGWTSGHPEPSWFVVVCVVFLIGVIGVQGIRHKSRGLVVLAAVLLLGQGMFTFFLSRTAWFTVMYFPGIGGELILATLLVVAFHYRMPDPMRWDFFRFPALVVGLYTFGRAFLRWWDIRRGLSAVPYGTWMSSTDAGGDMNQLREAGFSEPGLIKLYLTVALVCGGIMLAHYLVFGLRASRRQLRARGAP